MTFVTHPGDVEWCALFTTTASYDLIVTVPINEKLCQTNQWQKRHQKSPDNAAQIQMSSPDFECF